ncbi:hydroxyethylthiazole kinase [Isoptericola hypogeus]|uniref:Hydroxyethylthiazole kinase n=1 Tax=Isoptericola hypogeus TaxID=300179 RepID=A0ABP4VRW2_9MICO
MNVPLHGDDAAPATRPNLPENAPDDAPDDALDTAALVSASADLLDDLRAQAPLVQVVTNSVVTNVTANVLLALGASPAMCDVPGEAGPFARVADGLLVNLGTPHAEQRAAALEAATAAREAGTPWVLDPVAVGSLPVRTQLAHALLAHRPTVVRGNASEVLALAGAGAGGRGVDTTDTPEAALPAARRLAADAGSVVAVSGPVDVVTDGDRVVRVHTGHPLLTRMTGGGCALGAVMAAFAGVARRTGRTPAQAALAATVAYTLAAERAARAARGPGSFAVALLDELDRLRGEDVRHRARVSAGAVVVPALEAEDAR